MPNNTKVKQNKYARKHTNPKQECKTKNNLKDTEVITDHKKFNDPSWYSNSPTLLRDVASLPFSNVLGRPIDIGPDFIGPDGVLGKYTFPGIMNIFFEPTLGCGDKATDAPTVAADYIFTEVRKDNSGYSNYEAVDMFMLSAAWYSAASFIESCKRAYGMISNYTARNRYYVDSIVRASGFNPESIRNNLPRFRTIINLAAARLNSIHVPGGMPLGERWKWLNSHYYVDGTSSKAQTYIFCSDSFLKFDGYKSETGTQLIPVQNPGYFSKLDRLNGYGCSVDEAAQFITDLIDPLVLEGDVDIMSGDITKAYGESDCARVDLIDPDYFIIPDYNEEVLSQIHNAHSVGALSTHTITQTEGRIVEVAETMVGLNADTSVDIKKKFWRLPKILDMYKDEVTPADVIVATRLTSGLGEFTTRDNSTYFTHKRSGSEVCTGFGIVLAPYDISGGQMLTANIPSNLIFGYTRDTGSDLMSWNIAEPEFLTYMSAFDWHPRAYMYSTTTGVAAVEPRLTLLGDLENYTQVTNDQLQLMNDMAILSEAAVTKKTDIR